MSSKDLAKKMSRFEELDPAQFANWKSTKDLIIYARGELKHGLCSGTLAKTAQSSMSKAANALEGLDQNMTKFVPVVGQCEVGCSEE